MIKRFNVARALRTSTSPDFLMENLRGEGEHLWLLPIIQSDSKIVARLPGEAAVKILMASLDDDKMGMLTGPLFAHVGKALRGEFGWESGDTCGKYLLERVMEGGEVGRVARSALQECLGGFERKSAEVCLGWLPVLEELWKGKADMQAMLRDCQVKGLKTATDGLLVHYALSLDPKGDAKVIAEMVMIRVMDVIALVNDSEEFYGVCSGAVEAVMLTKKKSSKGKKGVKSYEGVMDAAVNLISNAPEDADVMPLKGLLFDVLRKDPEALGVSGWITLLTSKTPGVSEAAAVSCPNVKTCLLSTGIAETDVVALLHRGGFTKGWERKADFSFWGLNSSNGAEELVRVLRSYEELYDSVDLSGLDLPEVPKKDDFIVKIEMDIEEVSKELLKEEQRELDEEPDDGVVAMKVEVEGAGMITEITEEYINKCYGDGTQQDMLREVERWSEDAFAKIIKGIEESNVNSCQIAVWLLRGFLSAAVAEEAESFVSTVSSLLSISRQDEMGDTLRLLFRHETFAGIRARLDDFVVLKFLGEQEKGGWAGIDPSLAAAWAYRGDGQRMKELLLGDDSANLLMKVRRGAKQRAEKTHHISSSASC